MSMNPARSFSSAAPAHLWSYLWIYFVDPVLGMLTAAELRSFVFGVEDRGCAKLHHADNKRCIFCGHRLAATAVVALAVLFGSAAYAAPALPDRSHSRFQISSVRLRSIRTSCNSAKSLEPKRSLPPSLS